VRGGRLTTPCCPTALGFAERRAAGWTGDDFGLSLVGSHTKGRSSRKMCRSGRRSMRAVSVRFIAVYARHLDLRKSAVSQLDSDCSTSSGTTKFQSSGSHGRPASFTPQSGSRGP
jgi:hypothetical protein